RVYGSCIVWTAGLWTGAAPGGSDGDEERRGKRKRGAHGEPPPLPRRICYRQPAFSTSERAPGPAWALDLNQRLLAPGASRATRLCCLGAPSLLFFVPLLRAGGHNAIAPAVLRLIQGRVGALDQRLRCVAMG